MTLLALCEGNPMDSPHKGPVMWALMISLMLAWTKIWTNSWVASDWRCHDAHCDITVCVPLWTSVWLDLYQRGMRDWQPLPQLSHSWPKHSSIPMPNNRVWASSGLVGIVMWHCPYSYPFLRQKGNFCNGKHEFAESRKTIIILVIQYWDRAPW